MYHSFLLIVAKMVYFAIVCCGVIINVYNVAIIKMRTQFLHLPGIDEASKLPAESREEICGPSHRIGLSGANKTMLHLLKKAKVQLIKIDQQKQLKLSQVRSLNSRLLIQFSK